jgi:hypothetical protein
MNAPDAAMLAVADKLAGFIVGRGLSLPADLFAREVVIVENFAPFIFRDVATWAKEMRAHLADLSDLHHRFGAPVDFARDGDAAYFAMPTTWSGFNRGVPFTETGGWALVLKLEAEGWRLAGYGWAVIETSVPQ